MSDQEATLEEFSDDSEPVVPDPSGETTRESQFWETVPDGWELVDGSEIYEVNPNPTPDKEPNTYIEMDALDTELPWPEYFGERTASEYSGKTFTSGDTLFARITPCTENGKAAFVPEMDTCVGIGSTEFAVLSPNQDRVLPWYLYYVAKSHPVHNYAISRMRGSTGRQRVPFSVFRRELEVLLPPSEEQHKIASVLYTVDQALRKTDEIIEQTKRAKRGIAQNLFHYGTEDSDTTDTWLGEIPTSWDVIEFSEIIESTRNGLYKSDDGDGESYPVAKMGNVIYNLVLDTNNFDRLELSEDEKEKYALEQGDLVFARRAQEVSGAGDCVIVPELDELTVFSSSLIQVRLTDEVDPMFYAQYFDGPVGGRSIKRIVTETSISGVATSDLVNLKVPVPSGEEQEQIASLLSSFDEQVRALNAEMDQLKRFKQGLTQDLLSGEVRTHDKDIKIIDDVLQHG